jgi:hypothetical protein
MQKAMRIVKATGATLTLGLGFKPDVVSILNRTDLTGHIFRRRDITNRYGVTRAAAGDWAQAADAAHGVIIYAGGDKMSAASTIYLVDNTGDQRAEDVAAGAKVATFTMDTVANKTGHFNCNVVGATIGLNSKITFEGDSTIYTIVALTAGQGASADQVTLDASPGSGAKKVTFIGSRWDMTGAASGIVIPEGITIGATATVNNTDGDVLEVIAETL